VITGSHHGVNEMLSFGILITAWNGSLLLAFQYNLSIPSSSVKWNGTDRLSWNVGKKLLLCALYNTKIIQISFLQSPVTSSLTGQSICLSSIFLNPFSLFFF
jgi:hypothetical protein